MSRKVESAADVGNDHRDPQSVRGKLYRLIGVAIGNTLTFVWCAMLAWAIYFMPFICSVPARMSRLVQIYLLMGTLMLPGVSAAYHLYHERDKGQSGTDAIIQATKDG
jgi:hypothetical protein